MKLPHGAHLAYCTNIHRGETWGEILDSLKRYTLAVRDKLAAGEPYAIGLRLGHAAATELSEPGRLEEFRRWLRDHHCYVFTINGFPYGRFHGTRVKEQVYAPDWTTEERLSYTCRLIDIIGELVPEGLDGSVSTVPVSFKGFLRDPRQEAVARQNLWRCVEHLERRSREFGRSLHMGLEPEPMCTLETTDEVLAFFERMAADRPGDLRLKEHLGVNYDCCHLAVQYESAEISLSRLHRAGIRLSKIHLSSALKLHPTAQARQALHAFAEDTYLHQVVARHPDGRFERFLDLDQALATHNHLPPSVHAEWRIHFHVPLHHPPTDLFDTTSDHVLDTIRWLRRHPGVCRHLEMETYTWEVMPVEMKRRTVVEQLVGEYGWCLEQLR